MHAEQFPHRARAALMGDGRSAPADRGFTLVEILIAIVLVGVLAAVAVVGIGRLADKASAATCQQSADASRVATSSYYATHLRYPETFADLTDAGGSGAGALVLPAGVTGAGGSLTGGSWALTMVSGAPPTFSCGPSQAPVVTTTTTAATTTTTTTAPTTTTTPAAGNGVTATASTAGDLRYYGEQIVTLTNSSPLTAMTVTVSIAQTAGLSPFQQYTTFWSGTTAGSWSTSGGVAVYTFSLNPGQTIVAGSWTLASQWTGTGELHPTAGDTWTVLSTSQGRTTRVSGTF